MDLSRTLKQLEKIFDRLVRVRNTTGTLDSIAARLAARFGKTNDHLSHIQRAITGLQAGAKIFTNFARSVGISTSSTVGAANAQLRAIAISRKYTQASKMAYRASLLLGEAFVATGFVSLVQSFYDMNKALLQIDSSMVVRKKLLSDILGVQLRTGAATEDILKAQQALIENGLKFNANNRDTLKTVVLMTKALGLSAESSAKLALYSSILKSDLNDIGDGVTFALNKTELTAIEAADLAISMGKFNQILGNSNVGLGQLTATLSVFAGKIKSLGGSDKAVINIIEKFQTLQGTGSAMLFGGIKGIFDPSAFANADKMAAVIQSVGDRLNQLTGGGNATMLSVLEPLVTRMGISLADARAIMSMAKNPAEMKAKLKEAADLQARNGLLQTRYNQQLVNLGETFSSIKNRVSSLLKLGLLPLFEVIGTMASAVNGLLGYFEQFVQYVYKAETGFAKFVKIVVSGIGLLFSIGVGTLMVSALTRATAALGAFLITLNTSVVRMRVAAATAPLAAVGNVGGSVGAIAAAARIGAARFGSAGGIIARISLFGRFLAPLVMWTGRLVSVFSRLLPVIGWIITGLMAGKWIYDWFKNQKKESAVGVVNRQTSGEIASLIRRGVKYNEYDNTLELVASQIRASQTNKDLLEHLENSFYAADSALAQKKSTYQRDTGYGGSVNSITTDVRNTELQKQEALLSSIYRELVGLREAVKLGSSIQVDTLKTNSLKERMQQSRDRLNDSAMRPAATTFFTDK